MARIDLGPFKGEMPISDPRYLPLGYAQVARNVDLRRGRLEPLKAPLDLGIAVAGSTETIYLFNPEASGGFWFTFDTDVDVIRGPVDDDTNLRTYYTGDGVPKFTTVGLAQSAPPYPTNSRDLGLPVPATPTATGPGGTPPSGTEAVDTTYVITFVSEFSEEGPTSFATSLVSRWDGSTVNLTNIPIPSGNFNVIAKRIYRSESGNAFQLVAEIGAGATTYDDSINSNQLGAINLSAEWVAPPAALTGLTKVANGVLAGFVKNTLYFCEPFIPHAWPLRYKISFSEEIIAIKPVPSGVLVMTTGKPSLAVGSTPGAMSEYEIDDIQPCVSKRSAVDLGEYVVYASNDGLVGNGGSEQVPLITGNFITPKQWRTLINPSSIHAYRYDNRYLAFYDNGVTQGSFTFHPEEGFRFYDEYCDCAYLTRTGRLVIKQGTALKAWEEGANTSFTWRSPVFPTPRGELFGACQIDAQSYPVTLEYFISGISRKTKTVSDNKAFLLPGTFENKRDQFFEVRGTNVVTNIQLASYLEEII